jgi:hypothetical protein
VVAAGDRGEPEPAVPAQEAHDHCGRPPLARAVGHGALGLRGEQLVPVVAGEVRAAQVLDVADTHLGAVGLGSGHSDLSQTLVILRMF